MAILNEQKCDTSIWNQELALNPFNLAYFSSTPVGIFEQRSAAKNDSPLGGKWESDGDRARSSPLVFPTTQWRSDRITWRLWGWNELPMMNIFGRNFHQDLTDLETAGLPLPTVNQIELGCPVFFCQLWSPWNFPHFFDYPSQKIPGECGGYTTCGPTWDAVELRINPFLYRKKWAQLSEQTNEIDHSNCFDANMILDDGRTKQFFKSCDYEVFFFGIDLILRDLQIGEKIYVENALPWADGCNLDQQPS